MSKLNCLAIFDWTTETLLHTSLMAVKKLFQDAKEIILQFSNQFDASIYLIYRTSTATCSIW